jgi:SusD family.
MKNIIKFALSAIAALAIMPSCDAILDQESPSTFDGTTVFANYTLAEGTIFGITETFCEVNSYRGRFLPWYGFNTDIEWYNTYKPGDGKSDIAAYDCAVNNAQLNTANNPYVLMYTGIERANLVIEGLREYGKTDENADMAYLLGEALTLRAMIYYDLIKAWGDVPARFESVNAETIYVKKESRDVIFNQILADLDEAIPYLPYPNKTAATSTNDRINKVFAEGLYARIALAASGYALRPGDGKVGTGDAGTVRLSSDANLSKDKLYPQAYKYLQDAILNGGCSLYPDFEGYWKRQNNQLNVNYDGETIYVIPFGEGRGRWNFTFAISANAASINGYTISRGGDAGPVPTMYFKYDPKDVRRDVSCVNYGWTKNGVEPAGISKWYFGKYRFDWMDNVPYSGGNDDGVKPVVMRYADILLMAAEIANEMGDLTAAKNYLLPVRQRAFKGNEALAESFVEGITSKDAMFDAIVDERALEFCGEFLRKGDLIRWNMLTSKMDEAAGDMLELRSLSGKYSYLTGDVYYKVNDAEDAVIFYGLSKGENGSKGDDWTLETGYVTKYDDAKSTGFYTDRIYGIYYKDPDTHMYWPIFQNTIDNSQGNLVNDYGF